jgi:hypothetical protein
MGNRPDGLTPKAEEEKDFRESQVRTCSNKSVVFSYFPIGSATKRIFSWMG